MKIWARISAVLLLIIYLFELFMLAFFFYITLVFDSDPSFNIFVFLLILASLFLLASSIIYLIYYGWKQNGMCHKSIKNYSKINSLFIFFIFIYTTSLPIIDALSGSGLYKSYSIIYWIISTLIWLIIFFILSAPIFYFAWRKESPIIKIEETILIPNNADPILNNSNNDNLNNNDLSKIS